MKKDLYFYYSVQRSKISFAIQYKVGNKIIFAIQYNEEYFCYSVQISKIVSAIQYKTIRLFLIFSTK